MQRRSESTAAVHKALQRAALRRGEAEAKGDDLLAWSTALAAAPQAQALAAAGPIDVRLRQRVAELAGQLQRDHDAVRTRLAADELDEAIAAFEESNRLDPNSAEGLSNFSLALHQKGRYVDAIAAGHKAIRLQPDRVLSTAGTLARTRDACATDSPLTQ
jgi:tetratricopeptide (TPR) repeat protein